MLFVAHKFKNMSDKVFCLSFINNKLIRFQILRFHPPKWSLRGFFFHICRISIALQVNHTICGKFGIQVERL